MSRRQAERSEATRRELLRVARELFTAPGYAETSLEDVAAAAGVTKGAIYHHFRNKLELFQAVFEELEQELVGKVVEAAAAAGDDVWEAMRAGTRAYLDACLDPATQRVVLVDGPSVLGWHTWREIDERYGFGLVRASLQGAIDAGLIEERPVEPLAHIFLAALGEAGLQIARADDTERAMSEMSSAVLGLLESFRVRRS